MNPNTRFDHDTTASSGGVPPLLTGYHSLEFQPRNFGARYQFRPRHLDHIGACVLVAPESRLLLHLCAGDTLTAKCYPQDPSQPPVIQAVRITLILPAGESRFQGHVLVGLCASGGARSPEAARRPAGRVRPTLPATRGGVR